MPEKSQPKIFRDPLFNYVSVDRASDGWLLELIDSPEFQRLRRIRQLGVSSLTYPGAEHSRFSHSLGVLHLMSMAVAEMQRLDPSRADEARAKLLAAALLHDIGHGPLSHMSEMCIGEEHEKWTVKIIKSEQTKVCKILTKRFGKDMPNRVAALIEKDNPSAMLWQKQLLSSELDVDRLDYLRRDSLFSGAGYGHYDWYRLLHTFKLHEANGQATLIWSMKAVYGIEEYIFARFYMYQNVYLHKTTRGFERMFQAMWSYARELHKDGKDVSLLEPISQFWKEPEDVERYLRLDDTVILRQIQEWLGSPHAPLKDLASCFVDRKRFVSVLAPPPKDPIQDSEAYRNDEWEEELRKLVANKGHEPAHMYALKDVRKMKFYDPYVPEPETGEQDPCTAILIDTPGGPEEISRRLPRLENVTKKQITEVYYYVPLDTRAEADDLSAKMSKADADSTDGRHNNP